LSLALLKGEFVKGDTIRFTVDDTGEKLVFGH
jgi:ATP-dependent Clp protease ATP-binding subunit ClpB